MEFPSDLKTLPTAPYDERPSSLPLDVEETRTALWLENGNIGRAAARLKTSSSRLRRFVQGSPRLLAEQREVLELLADKAVDNVRDALYDEVDAGRRDSMSKWYLDRIGKDRGFTTAGGNSVSARVNVGPISIEWLTEPLKQITVDGEYSVTPDE